MKMTELLKKIKRDFSYRTILTTIFSLFINFLFAIYNGYLGMKHHDEFAIGIFIYYLLLFWIMVATLVVEKHIAKEKIDVKNKIRIKNYKIATIFIFLMDFCLIAPIILMVVKPKEVQFGLIPAIIMATYCVYKITFAIINYRKSHKTQNLSIILIKQINIIGAIVSILTLQHTLIMVNGGMNKEMQNLSFITSIGFILVIIVFSLVSFMKNRQLFHQPNN